MPGAKVTWLTTLPSLIDADAERDRADFFQTQRWFAHLAAHGIESAEGLHVARVDEGPSSSGWLLPLQLRRDAPAAAFGASVASLSNYYSSLFGPIGDGRVSAEACGALVEAMRTAIPASAVVDLQPLDADAPFIARMEAAFAAAGYSTDRYFCFGNWYLPVEGRRWDEIEPTVASRQRNTVRRARKKLDDAGAHSLHIVTAPGPELEAAIADYESIYRRSWKQPEPFPEFVPRLCRWTADQGYLRLGVVRVGHVPVAAQIWFVYGGRALIFKLAYDDEFKRLSAGSVLTAALMRHVVDTDRVTEIVYLTGDDSYKADWMSHRRERVGLVAFSRRSAAGLAALAKHRLGRWRAARRAAAAVQPVDAGNPAAAAECR